MQTPSPAYDLPAVEYLVGLLVALAFVWVASRLKLGGTRTMTTTMAMTAEIDYFPTTAADPPVLRPDLPLACGEWAQAVSGPHAGLAGTVRAVSLGPREESTVLIELQTGEWVSADRADVCPLA